MSGDDLHDELQGAIHDARRLQGELERFELAVAAEQEAGLARSGRRRRRLLLAAGPVAVLAVAVLGWALGLRPAVPTGWLHRVAGSVAGERVPGAGSATGSVAEPAGTAGAGQAAGAGCARLQVVAATPVAAALRTVARGLATGQDCASVTVTVADGRGAARAALAAGADVWVPDDPAWVASAPADLLPVLASAGSAGSGPAGQVLATSPLLLVTDAGSAGRLAAAGGGWKALNRLVGTEKRLRLVTADPQSSGDGLLAVGGLGEVVWLADGMDASAAALSTLHTRTRTAPVGALRPERPGEVAVLPEFRMARPPAGQVVVVPKDRTALLRFSWMVTRSGLADPARAAALQRFSAALLGPVGQAAFGAAGLRGPDGRPLPASATGSGTPSSTGSAISTAPATPVAPVAPVRLPAALPVLEPHHVDHVFATWYPQDRTVDLLVVVDVSRSMSRVPPGTDQELITLVKQGCVQVAGLLPDRATLGVWAFGRRLDGTRDYRQLVEPGPLDRDQRRAVGSAVGRLSTERTATGLYDTVLAAYRSAVARARPGVPSQVLVFTDGRDEADPGSVGAAGLARDLTAIRAANPAAASVSLGVMAFGDADHADLERALTPVQGYVDPVRTAAEVTDAFLHLAAGGLHT
jgi:hypothetical protein